MKNKYIAAALALFLGGFGVHKFYLGQTFQGILYLCFCWTYIPSIVAFIESLMYLFCSDNEFQVKYCDSNSTPINGYHPIVKKPTLKIYENDVTKIFGEPSKQSLGIDTGATDYKKCPNCGFLNNAENNFCESCGTKL